MKKSLILFFLASLLAGCAQLPEPQTVPWLNHQQQLTNLNDWSLTGKLAVITPQERHSLNIYWQQSGNDFHITLTTFLGITVLDLIKTSSGTLIVDNNGKQFFGEDAQTLIKQLSGLTIPVDALQQWIKGNPSQASYQLNSTNQVATLIGIDSQNARWSINYSDYKDTQGIALPYKLQLKHAEIRLKFAIAHWNPHQ
jgi:outer membrane lipoprotein LolB